MSHAIISQYAAQIRSLVPNPGGSIIATAVDRISAALQDLETALAKFGPVQQDQLGNVSVNALGVTNFTRLFDFFQQPEIQYITTAATMIQVTGSWVRLNNKSGGSLTLTSAPTIAAGTRDGEFLEIFNVGSKDFVFQDSTILASSGIRMSAGQITLAPFGTLQFRWSTVANSWVQIPGLPNNSILSSKLVSNGSNLLDNPGFDLGNNGAWNSVIAAATPLTISTTPDLPPPAATGWTITNEGQGRVGVWAGKHVASSNTNDIFENNSQIYCKPGDQFVLSGYAKSSSGVTDGTMSVTILFYDSSYAYNGTRVAVALNGGNTSYQQILFSATAPANTITARVFWQAQNHTTGVWYVDDTSCTAVQASTALNIGQLSIGPNGSLTISGFTWTANSPGAGSIAWSAGFLSYKGVLYSIPAGNTALQFVYWQLSSPNSFQTTALPLPTLGVDDFIIAENNAGKYNVAFDMVRSDGGRTVMIGDSFFIINSNGKLMADFDNANGHGLLELRDSTGTVTLSLDGSTGIITSNGTAMTVP